MPDTADPTSLMNDLTNSITAVSGLSEAQTNGASVEAKEKLVHAARDLLQQLESPEDAIFRVAFGVRQPIYDLKSIVPDLILVLVYRVMPKPHSERHWRWDCSRPFRARTRLVSMN